MKRLLPVVLLVSALCGAPATAGEVITFTPSYEHKPEVLRNVALKALITEFLDPEGTGIGKTIAYLAWRETLTAISDQPDAGVVLARTAAGDRLAEMLANDYHAAADRIARDQQARMVLWGAASEAGGEILVDSNLSVLAEKPCSDLRLRLGSEHSNAGGLSVPIPRTRFNFDGVVTSREALFSRALVTRSAATLRQTADESAPEAGQVAAGVVLDAVDMEGNWFKIRKPGRDAGFAFVSLGKVELPPRLVDADLTRAELRAAAGRNAAKLATVALKGSYRVLDMRYLPRDGLWYRIKTETQAGWIPAGFVRARFSFSAVHFLAGLYRFYAGRYADAAREFEQFIAQSGPKASNVNLASAYQLLGAARLMGRPVGTSNPGAVQAFSSAIELTPFDPAAYLLRSVARLGSERQANDALRDVDKALTLDRRNVPARALAIHLSAIAEGRADPALAAETGLRNAMPAVRSLKETYSILE